MLSRTLPLECRKLTAEWKRPLLTLLSALDENDTEYFCPHAFNHETIEGIICNARRDLYYVLTAKGEILGYGMLRGWDEGYDIPSLGIVIHPSARGRGLGRLLMHFLTAAARQEGAKKVRLRVRLDNARARSLYKSLGYEFKEEEKGYMVGFLDLSRNLPR
jgi:[ribosomal protein S18]-alanine N-acetyltransferase